MPRQFIAFDVEIVKDIPEGQDWHELAPLGISCAATMKSGSDEPFIFYHGRNEPPGDPLPGPMTQAEVIDLVNYLVEMEARDYLICNHNGLGFDFPVLAIESGMTEVCRLLALDSVDSMFNFLAIKGFQIALETLAQGLGVKGKDILTFGATSGHGELAPQLWRGTTEERNQVLKYVAQDARTTLEVIEEAERRTVVTWTAKSGRQNVVLLRNRRWLSVRECLTLPEPDTSWMTNPMKRETFTDWLKP